MIRYKYPHLEAEFTNQLHEKVRSVVGALSDWSEIEGIPGPVVTEIGRTDQQQLNYYFDYGSRALNILRMGRTRDGIKTKLSVVERDHAIEIERAILGEVARTGKNYSPGYEADRVGIAIWALNRFTWHRCFCAADLRNSHYDPKTLARVVAFIGSKVVEQEGLNPKRRDWEFLVHDIGRGDHIHLAYRDNLWRENFLKAWKSDLDKLKIPELR